MPCGLQVGLTLLLLTATGPAHAGTPSFVETIEAIAPDPNSALFQTHYVTSNERHHGLTVDLLRETGGVFIGVGTDQNFIAIPTLKPTHVVMVDFDQWVVDTHRVYRHVFSTRATPEAFLAFFEPESRRRARRELAAAYPDPVTARRVQKVYLRYQEEIFGRLNAEKQRLTDDGADSYLTHQTPYDTLRRLCLDGRYVSLRGDLTGERSLVSLAAALKRMNLKVGAVALSNAEQYFDYSEPFRRNMQALDFLDSAVIIRTWRYKRAHYEYYIQSASAFLEWLQRPRAWNFSRLIRARLETSRERVYTVPGRETCLHGLCPVADASGAIPFEGCCDEATLSWTLLAGGETRDYSCDPAAACYGPEVNPTEANATH
jgi:hypothetical protein